MSSPTSVIVLGAGWYGIAAAKTYLQFDPSIDLTVIDAENSVGGVWSSSRVYPGLIADSPAGLFEFSDMKMSEELGLEEWADIKGSTVQEYLERYAQKFGVLDRCRLNTGVSKVQRCGLQWAVHIQQNNKDLPEILYCDKLIIGTGITSNPWLPDLATSEFKGRVFHSKDLGRMHPFLTSPEVHNVTVVGGNKSAVEAVTMCATAGKKVTWLIRKEGKGPGILFTTRRNGRHRAADGAARWSGIFRPDIYAARPWIHRFFYSGKNRLGTWLCQCFWKAMTRMILASHQSKHPNRKLLNPESTDFFWPVSGVSFLHDTEEALMELVEDGTLIQIFCESMKSLRGNSVHISDGQIVEADAVIFDTGWKSSQRPLFDAEIAAELGLPIPLSTEDPAEAAHWKALQMMGDEEVLTLYPVLAKPPHPPAPRTTTPHRLFRTIAPPKLSARGDNSVAFIGLISNNQVSSHAEISALWAVAYLTGRLYDTSIGPTLVDQAEMELDVATMNAFMARRYLGRKEVPDAAMEIQDYTDLMMRDLGLRADRKRMQAPASLFGVRAFKAEYFSPYMPRDYRGAVDAFLRMFKKESKR